MNRCGKCKVGIYDDTVKCPLCNNVVTRDDKNIGAMYPDISLKIRKIDHAIKIFIFACVIAEMLLGIINYYSYNGLWWSAICGGAMIYLCFTLKYTVQHNSGYMSKLIAQTIGAIALAVLIDFILGYQGWSVNFAIPCTIILVNIAIVVFMIVNSLNWQSYLPFQIIMIGISIVTIILIFCHIVTYPILTIVAATTSLGLFTGTIIVGDRKAITELNRRFRI